MNKQAFFIPLIFIFLANVFPTNYYISPTGDDSQKGTSPAIPWKTVDKVNNTKFLPGDSILFERDGVWRVTPLRVSSSGTKNNHIIYTSYGTGEKPQILGSVLAENWSNVGGNIWVSETIIPLDPWEVGYDGPEIFFEENDGKTSWGMHMSYVPGFSNLTSEYHWTWNDKKIYVLASSNPDSAYAQIEIPQLAEGIMLLDNNYITITGICVKYYADAGIYDNYPTPKELFGLHVTHCEISHIGKKDGAAAYGLNVHHSDALYAFNEIHNCGRRGISLTMYATDPSIQQNVIIENNHIHHGWHTTSLDCSISAAHTIQNIIFRNNLVEGDSTIVLGGLNSNSNHIYIANESPQGGVLKDFYFHNNIFKYASASSIKIASIADVYIHNNTFFNFNPSLTNWQAHVFTTNILNQMTVVNNIFHNNAVDNRLTAIKVDNSTGSKMIVDRNLYYQSSTGKRFWWVNNGTSYKDLQWDEYKTATGNDKNSPPPSDPLFIGPSIDLSLDKNSPARGKGIKVDWVTKDFNGKELNNPPDLGAIQYKEISVLHALDLQGGLSNINIRYYKNQLQVHANNQNIKIKSILLFNLQGKILFKSKFSKGKRRANINNVDLQPGVYVISISSANISIINRSLIVL